MKESTRKVINLRKQGETYKEIEQKTGLSLGNISYLCNKYVPENTFIHRENDRKAKEAMPIKQMAAMRAGAVAYYENLRFEAKNKWALALKKVDHKKVYYMLGLYDGEGNHSGTEFRVCNSDPTIVAFIIEFLKEIEADYCLELYLHSSHNKNSCIKKWGLNFDKVRQYDSREQSRDYSATENYGTVQIRVKKPLGLREALREYSQIRFYRSTSFS